MVALTYKDLQAIRDALAFAMDEDTSLESKPYGRLWDEMTTEINRLEGTYSDEVFLIKRYEFRQE